MHPLKSSICFPWRMNYWFPLPTRLRRDCNLINYGIIVLLLFPEGWFGVWVQAKIANALCFFYRHFLTFWWVPTVTERGREATDRWHIRQNIIKLIVAEEIDSNGVRPEGPRSSWISTVLDWVFWSGVRDGGNNLFAN